MKRKSLYKSYAAGGDVDDNTNWNQIAGYAGAGLNSAFSLISALTATKPSDYSDQPIVNASTMRNMVTPNSKFAVGGDVGDDGGGDLLTQLQAMADEQGITLDELISKINGNQSDDSPEDSNGQADQETEEESPEEDVQEGGQEEDEYAVGGTVDPRAPKTDNLKPIVTPNMVAKDRLAMLLSSAPGSIPVSKNRVTYPGDTLTNNQIEKARLQVIDEDRLNPSTNFNPRTSKGLMIRAGMGKDYQLAPKDIEKIDALGSIFGVIGDVKQPNALNYLPAPQHYGMGGTADADINAEGGEVIETPDGSVRKIKGPKHEQGGVDLTVPKGSKIYSDRVKIDGKSMEERKIGREKALARLERLATKNPHDNILKDSVVRQARGHMMEEQRDMAVQNALREHEEKFDVGGTAGDEPTNPYAFLYPIMGKYPVSNKGEATMQDPLEEISGNIGSPAINRRLDASAYTPLEISSTMGNKLFNFADGSANTGNITVGTRPLDRIADKDTEEGDHYTTGDMIGLAGNAFNAIAPILNTQNAARNTKPNINRFRGFGRNAIVANDKAQDINSGILGSENADIDTTANTAFARNRNSAQSVNTVRALDALTTMGQNKAKVAAGNNASRVLSSLLGQRGQIEMKKDQMEMQGETNRDLADKADTDNYYSNMASNIVNAGHNIEGIGRNLNVAHSNTVDSNLVSQLSKYGLGFDKNGKLITKKKKSNG